MKSAKKTPVESDEPGPWKHARRPKIETFKKWELWGRAHRSWRWPSGLMWLCRLCSHDIERHYRGLCDDCHHECDGADALHDELLPIKADVRRIYEKHTKPRQSK